MAEAAEEHPMGVTGHTLASVGTAGLFLVGGWNPLFSDGTGMMDSHYIRQVHKYNLSTKSWKRLRCSVDTTPVELASHCVAAVSSNRLVLFGGSLSPLGQLLSSNRTHWYYTVEQAWQEVACSGHLPPQNLGHWFGQAAFYSRREEALYVASGEINGPMHIHRLNLNTYKWTSLTESHQQRSDTCIGLIRHAIVVSDDHLFIFGGGLDFQSPGPAQFSLAVVPTFEISKKKWTFTLCDGPPDILTLWPFASSVVLYKNCVFLIGGLLWDGEGGRCMDEILRLDLNTRTWTVYGRMPSPSWFQAATVTDDGQLCVFGGCASTTYTDRRLDEMVVVDVDVRSLQCLAWKVLLDEGRAPILAAKSKSQLRSIGIPQTFISALFF